MIRFATQFVRVRYSSTLSPKHARLVNAQSAPQDFDASSAVVYEAFLSHEEGASLVQDIQAKVKRRRYEKGHWDAVITDYKEIELLDEMELDKLSRSALQRTRDFLLLNHLDADSTWLPCHAIDLKKDGELKAHIDSVRFSGGMVAGVSLLSPSVMRLRPGADVGRDPTEGFVDLYLPPLSLYVLSGVSRYQYAHELRPTGSVFETQDGTTISVERDQRLSVIFRDAKKVQ